MAVLGFGRGTVGVVAPLRFEMLDHQPGSSNVGPVPTDFYAFCDFAKICCGLLTRYVWCFQPGRFESAPEPVESNKRYQYFFDSEGYRLGLRLK